MIGAVRLGELGREALAYAERELPLFPLGPGTKVPATRNGFRDATTDPGRIARYWERRPDANIGIPTGGPSGLAVLDVDPRHGGDDALHALEAEHDPLAEMPRSKTGGGGEQLFFRHVPGLRCSAGKLGPGLDVRAEGGYIVAPPSVHPSGRPYAWDVPFEEAEPPLLPGWILARLREDRSEGPRPASHWRQLAQGVGEGKRNATAAQLCGHLLARGVDPIVVLELLVAWDAKSNRPPLGRAEVERVCESIASRELAKIGARRGSD